MIRHRPKDTDVWLAGKNIKATIINMPKDLDKNNHKWAERKLSR